MISLRLTDVAESYREMLRTIGADADVHAAIMDNFYKLCETSGVGNRTAVQSLCPDITDEEYYDGWSEVAKPTYCGADSCEGCDGYECRPC